MLEAQVSYFEGELTDSISFVWNADGTIKAILNVSEGSGTFFTYQIGELKEAIWIIDDNLDGKLNETDDSYEKYTYVVDNKLNPYYGLYIYETDYSQPLDETLFSRTFTKHNVISVTWTDGIDAETSTIKHTYNEQGYPIRSILTYPGGSDIATHTLMCK
jgi:hypothetical protein